MTSRPRLLVTRELANNAPMRVYFDRLGYEVTGSTPLRFEALEQGDLPEVDWVFVYSARGIELLSPQYIEQLKRRRIPIAVMGPGTARACFAVGLDVDLVGDGGPSEVAQQFAQVLGGAATQTPRVLFLQAESSTRSIELALVGRIRPLPYQVYRTILAASWEVPAHDALFVTSPSVARVLAGRGALDPNVELLAIGPTTAAELRALCTSPVTVHPPSCWHSADPST